MSAFFQFPGGCIARVNTKASRLFAGNQMREE